ncbi:cilia- and flagella-associated protein 65 [Fundulus diaphanus]
MLAEARSHGCSASVAPWKLSSTGTDVKEPRLPDRKRSPRKSSSQRTCFFGLETRPELLWEDWVLGREYTKTLVLKNTRDKMHKLHVRSPESTFFSTLNPEVVVLSPGTSFSLQVTFRPLQRREYKDSIQFQAKEGSFQVSLHAVLPSHSLKVPETVALPLCAVQHSTQTSFPLKNLSKVLVSFKWDCASPFQLIPEQGLLKPGQECLIVVDFRPLEAQVYQQQVHCRSGEDGDKAGSCSSVLLQGIAKYPYLQIRNPSNKKKSCPGDPELHFGSVSVGQSLTKHFEIFNPSSVNVCSSLSRLPGGAALYGSDFSWDVPSGKIAPGGSLQVSVTYSPTVVEIVSVEYLFLNYKGALSKTQIKLMGKCIGPEVCLSSSVVDFGCVEERGSAVETLELLNSSPVQAVYQWDIDCWNSVFSISPASGAVLPQGRIKVKVLYRPTHPMAHHRRVACLILHREPLFLDLIGTCHSEVQRPVTLKPEHLVVFKHQWSPGSVQDLPRDHNTLPDQQGEPNSDPVIPDTPREKCNKMKTDPFTSPSVPFVTIEPSELLFNHKATSPASTSSALSQCVSITNHAKGKLSLMWTVVQDSPFCVAPSSFELAPLKSTTVRVTYEPNQINTLHGGELECFAYYKKPQDDPETGQQRPCLPWCVTVRVIGHSFQPGQEHFTPCCTLNPHQVVFPARRGISCRTVLLHNNGDQPLTFCLNQRPNDALPKSVHMLPGCGLVQPEKHQIITIRAVPTEDSPKQGSSLLLQLNATKSTKELRVVRVLEKPRVSLESGGSLYFHPTAVGSRIQRTHSIRNLSCLPVKFQWSISETERKLIFVEPDAGELHPNESSVQTWSFSPLEEKTYTFRPTLSFHSDDSDKFHLTLELIGMGSAASVEAGKEVLDVGEILVGRCRSVEILLVNNSPCPVSFRLSAQRMLAENPSDSEENSALHLDCETGTVASHSTVQLHSTLRLCTQAQYLWAVNYQILNASGLGLSPPQKLCEVRAKGVYPTLQVTDACSGGSVARLCKQDLWTLFSLDSLNEHLLSTPSAKERTFKTPTKHSLQNSPSIFTKVMVDFKFGVAPLNSDPSDFMLMFCNPGFIPVDWAFLFPEDQQMELEEWAETGEFSSTDLHQMKVQDNQLFRVFPRSGTLLPGQKRAVHFSYSHDFMGTDRLPVVFKLSFGREILLNFEGVTLDRDEPYLHFASNQHVFTSVAIGDSSPPRQMYELYNGGAAAVHYEVDQAVLSQLQMDNYNHPILRCLSQQGDVLPGNKATIEWIFSPLEAKMYHMDVPIHIQTRDSVIIKFVGCGVAASSTISSNLIECSDKAPEHGAQKAPFPGQAAFLSEDSVSFGDIPVFTKSSRIFFLTSLCHADTLHYVWEIPKQHNQEVVQIHPERGCLGPGECAICVLTFVSDYPTVYRLDLICQITQEAALVRFHSALQRWEAEKKRQQEEFIITDKSAADRPRVLVDEAPLAPPARKGAPLRKYKTLPPICTSSSEAVGGLWAKQTRAEKRLQREDAQVWRRPQPPRPALLHLTVTAHSHDLRDYFTHFPDQYNKHYRYSTRTQKTGPKSSSTSLPADLFSSTHGAERDILMDILTSLYKNLLDDAAFTQSLMALATVPPVYRPHTSSYPSAIPPSVDGEGASGGLETVPQSQASPGSERAPADVIEAVLLNTLQNIMMEAARGELVLTAHPRTIMLPPSSVRSGPALAEEDQ